MRSSYIQNNYGPVFERTVQMFLPHRCVELGVLDGYSTLHMAKGARNAVKQSNHRTHIDAYDLWEDYPYNHGSKEAVQKMLQENDLDSFVTLHHEDAFEVCKRYGDHSICLLHVDISNDGEVLRKIVEQWNDKLSFGGMLMFEGGSEERDNVDWMKKYNKKPIKTEIESNLILNKNYIYATYNAFPSLSVFIKHH